MICVDELGPLELRPYKGQGWQYKKHPQRLPAESLISAFNRCGMAAITAGSRGKRKVVLPEEVCILHEVVRVPPKAVGLDAPAWTVELLQQTALARHWVDVADPAVLETLIAGRQRGVSSKPNCQTLDLPNRDRH